MLPLAKVIWGARCGKSARRVLLGETSARGHAHSVRRGRESAYDRKAPHGLPPPSLVPTNLLDLWFEKKMRRYFRGEAYLTRFADDFVANFQYKRDAEHFDGWLRKRFARFNLELADDKTRLLRFGRFAVETTAVYGERPERFDFLGFTHVCGTEHRRGTFAVVRLPSRKSCRKFLARTKAWLSGHRHWKRRDQQRQLTMMLRGFYQYFGLHHCQPRLNLVRHEVQLQWIRILRRRSQRHRLYWSYLLSRAWFELPYAETRHATV